MDWRGITGYERIGSFALEGAERYMNRAPNGNKVTAIYSLRVRL